MPTVCLLVRATGFFLDPGPFFALFIRDFDVLVRLLRGSISVGGIGRRRFQLQPIQFMFGAQQTTGQLRCAVDQF